jgi:uncharacterized protein with HEPN domain
MPRDPRALLCDAREALGAIAEFADARSAADYAADQLLRSGSERQFEICGEAYAQRARLAAPLAARNPALRQGVSVRNLLIHGDPRVDDDAVWRVVGEDVPLLPRTRDVLLEELGGASP